jgi:hypothetical protein
VALDAEESSFKAVMAQAEQDVLHFKDARIAGDPRRKRELQKALFPEGLTWFKRPTFEASKDHPINELGRVFDSLFNIAVPDRI